MQRLKSVSVLASTDNEREQVEAFRAAASLEGVTYTPEYGAASCILSTNAAGGLTTENLPSIIQLLVDIFGEGVYTPQGLEARGECGGARAGDSGGGGVHVGQRRRAAARGA